MDAEHRGSPEVARSYVSNVHNIMCNLVIRNNRNFFPDLKRGFKSSLKIDVSKHGSPYAMDRNAAPRDLKALPSLQKVMHTVPYVIPSKSLTG
jgi:hypothetical protein